MSRLEFKRPTHIVLFCMAGIAILTVFSVIHIYQHDYFLGITLAVSAVLLVVASLVIMVDNNKEGANWVIIFMMLGLHTVLFLTSDKSSTSLFWILIFPLVAYYTKGVSRGSFLSLILGITLSVLIGLSFFNVISLPYSEFYYLKLMVVYILICTMTLVYEKSAQKKENKIRKQIYYNSLTELPNRRLLIQDIANRRDFSLMLINLDDFKEVNDLFGAKVGDKVLLEVARRIAVLQEDETVFKIYKLHADEYAILIHSLDRNCSLNIVRKVSRFMEKEFSFGDISFYLSVSMGISSHYRDLLADADIALKMAKEKNRSYFFYDGAAQVSLRYRTNIQSVSRIIYGLKNDNIIPFFQPIYCNENNQVSKYECLARLRENKEILYPYTFLSIARRIKLYPEITRIMIEKSFSYFENLPYEFSLNLCKEDIIDTQTTGLIFRKLQNPKIARRVVFELLESERIEDMQEVTDFIMSVKNLGAQVAIDDFGSGYSNFEYLLRMNVDFIKIDASLIKNIVTDRNSWILTENIVDFCRKLNIKTVAEFVHCEEVHEKVRELGIDFSQGFYLGEPVESISSYNEVLL